MASRSAPVTTRPSIPSSAAIAPAVEAWSPVIIFTAMPASWHSTDRGDGLGARRVEDADERLEREVADLGIEVALELPAPAPARPREARARTRRPSPPSDSFAAIARARSESSSVSTPPAPSPSAAQMGAAIEHDVRGALDHQHRRGRTPSPSSGGCSVAMNFTAESNGTSPIRGYCARSASGSRPALAASDHERAFGGVADQLGDAVIVGGDMGVVAEHPGDERGMEERPVLVADRDIVTGGVGPSDGAVDAVAEAVDPVVAVRRHGGASPSSG